MKKKLFTLMTLLLCICSTAWGQEESISWAITTNTLNMTPTITPSSDAHLSNASTSISLTGFSQTSSQKDGYCKPFYGTAVDFDASTKYASISFKVADNYTFTPSSLGMTVYSHGTGNLKYKVIISDSKTTPTTVTSNEIQPSSGGEASITFASNAFTGKKFEGTVTIKLYAYNYSNTSSGKRTYIKSPITISGTVAADKTATAEALKASDAVKVNGSALTLNAATNGYSVSSNTITLSNDIQYTSTPSDIKLVKTITYDDSSTEDANVDVSFDGTVTDGYYVGTASIGLTGSVIEYTVKVKKDVTPTVATPTITITGATVVNETNWLTADTEVSIECETDGATIYYTTNGDVPTIVYDPSNKPTISSDGTYTIKAYAVKANCHDSEVATSEVYKKITLDTQADVTGYTKWDWADLAGTFTATGNGGINFPEGHPLRETDIVISNVPKYGYTFNIPSSFDAQKLVFNGQYPVRTASPTTFAGLKSIKFNTSVAGTVKVTYASNGTNSRFVKITNGENSTDGDASSSDSDYKTASMAVETGTVTMTGYQGTSTSYVRVKKIEFIPTIVSGTISASGWNTFSSNAALDLSTISGGKAYVATTTSSKSVKVEECTDIVAAGTGLMINGTPGETFTINTTADDATFSGTNLLVGLPNGGTVAANAYNYVFAWPTATPADYGFYYVNATEPTLPAGKAYLHVDGGINARLNIVFDGETTGINTIENSQLTIDNDASMYNLAGQKVSKSYKGIVIVNGKKVVRK